MTELTNKTNPGKLIVLGIQHMFAMFGATVLVPIITGLPVSVALFTAGIGTIMFFFITKRKVPVFLGSSFAFMTAIMAATEVTGDVAYATGGLIVAGALYLVLALLVKLFGADKIKSFFPPVVTGPIILLIGLMLASVAINQITAPIGDIPVWQNWLVALIAVLSIMGIAVFTKGFLKMIPILIGIFVAYIASLLFGMVNFDAINASKVFELPAFFLPKFSWTGILIVAPVAAITFVEHIGDITANSSVVGKDFIKDPGLHRTLIGDGIATMFAGLVGGPANTTYSENTGVLAATGNYNPITIVIAACFAVLMSFIGKFGGFISSIPGPVLGGVSIILFGMIASVGLRTLVENKVDMKNPRNMMIIGVMLIPALGGATIVFNANSGMVLTGYALAAVVGIVLNKVLPEKLGKTEK
ncbi:MAG: uracil-xanthine permease [Clostridiales bacterium]|nr:uracil-xanthine permease [Clostridiales bacterium]